MNVLKFLDTARTLITGDGQLDHDEAMYVFGQGDVLLLPSVGGAGLSRRRGGVSLLDILLPEGT